MLYRVVCLLTRWDRYYLGIVGRFSLALYCSEALSPSLQTTMLEKPSRGSNRFIVGRVGVIAYIESLEGFFYELS